MINILDDVEWSPQVIMLGKGPSAALRESVLASYPNALLVTLNHAIRWSDGRETWAHYVDVEAMEECKDYNVLYATFLLLPTIMNIGSHRAKERVRPTEHPAIFYDRDDVGLRYFSAEGALGALGWLGYERVLLCGVDGGVGYAPGLEDVAHRHLENGRASFDIQWKQLETIKERYSMEVYRVALE